MRQGFRLDSPALVISLIALFVALGGTVYAAKRMNGKLIRPKSLPGNRVTPRSLPGNRVKPRSLPANRLKPGVLRGVRITGPITGADINETTLGRVPSATHAESANAAQSAVDALTALHAVNAIDAEKVNGHSAGCLPSTRFFAGACWQSSAVGPATAPDAAADCTAQGGSLPEALELVAFSHETGVNLHAESEWSSDITNLSGEDVFAVVTVSPSGQVTSAHFNGGGVSALRHYRCVIPLVT